MPQLQQLGQVILSTGRVDRPELEALRGQLYANGKIDRRAADFLVELHKRVQRRSPAFDQFFYQAIKDHILADGRIGREDTDWLQQALFTGGKVRDEDRKFLHELKGEAKRVSPEFETLFKEVMKQPLEQHTSG